MDGLTLLDKAEVAGLVVSVDGEALHVRGPRSAEQLALKLIEHKTDVMSAIRIREDLAGDDEDLEVYLSLLRSPEVLSSEELAPVPPFRKKPERPLAWAAWWACLEGRRRRQTG